MLITFVLYSVEHRYVYVLQLAVGFGSAAKYFIYKAIHALIMQIRYWCYLLVILQLSGPM